MSPVQFKDYYAILGVNRDADQKEIKRAFRKKARESHPDVNRDDPNAEATFKDINEAYEVLSDSEKRAMYDRYGTDWQRYRDAGFDATNGPDPSSYQTTGDFEQWFTGSPGGGTFTYTTTSGPGEGGGFSDFFNLLFGRDGARGAGFQRTVSPIRGQDLEIGATVSLDEAYRGTTRRVTVRAPRICDLCDGSGVVRGAMCPRCDGSGEIMEPRTIEVKIPAGVKTGSRVRVRGQGGPGQHGGAAGDVYLNVTVSPDSRFERVGDNLRTTVAVPLYDAILGGEVRVPTMTGSVMLTVPPETQSGRTFRLRGKGMPKLGSSSQHGDLLVKVEVTIPTSLTDEEKKRFTELRNLRQ
ncbi:MAG TPA: DnaJ C-terminal domain-containing protein [Thermomicrobiales bacterium]|nr:DnaJ C-terminal domain-containing protein [Thermomicrobiales bacterium]